MKLRKYNGFTHINNGLAGRLKQGALPVQCLTAGAATLPSIHNVFSQNFASITHIFLIITQKPYAIFMQTLRKNIYSRYIFLRRHYAIHSRKKLRKNYALITQIAYAKYADITKTRLCSHDSIISVLRNYLTQILHRNYAK